MLLKMLNTEFIASRISKEMLNNRIGVFHMAYFYRLVWNLVTLNASVSGSSSKKTEPKS